jgi:hypothetical protein
MSKLLLLAVVVGFSAFLISCTVSTETRQGGGEQEKPVRHEDPYVRDWHQWELLGERRVDSSSRADHDSIEIGRREGKFSELAIRIENSRIELSEMAVTFTNGETYKTRDSMIFNADSTSRIISLPGDRRSIAKVDFWYRDLPGGGRANVQLYGR